MTDTEKRIAEIRVKVEFLDGCESKVEIDSSAIAQDYKFILSELDRIECEYAEERAAHNTHVTELCELEKENRKLREEREKWEKEARLQYRLFNEYHDESREKIEQLRAERAKLIEVLRHYADRRNHPPFWLHDDGKLARDTLKEIGVTVE